MGWDDDESPTERIDLDTGDDDESPTEKIDFDVGGDDLPAIPSDAAPARSGSIAWRLATVVVAHLILIASVLAVAARFSPRGVLTVHDVLALPEATIELTARITRRGPNFTFPLGFLSRDVAGIEVDFARADGTVIATGVTDELGFAAATILAPADSGAHVFTARATGGDLPADRREAQLVVSVTPPDHPIILARIDNTLYRPRDTFALEDVEPFESAASVLAARAITHRIVYLTSRDSSLGPATRRWLDANGFPPGPIFFRDAWAGKSRREFIAAAIKSKWKKVPWGIAGGESDIAAFLGNGIQPIVVSPDAESGTVTPGTRRVTDWVAVGKLLEESS